MLRRYTVQPGDTLISIAEKFYGNPKAFTDIFSANQDVIQDPYHLRPGTELYIPPSAEEIEREVHHRGASAPGTPAEQSQRSGKAPSTDQQRAHGQASDH